MSLEQCVPRETVDDLLREVEKPARYAGGEVNSIVKSGPVRARMALCFADVYEVAESHIGLKILYDIVNRVDDLCAERVYALWPDLEERARAAGVPLWSLETHRRLSAFDVIGFTLQYELSYATTLAMLDLGGVPVRSADRSDTDAFVIGGGAGAFNPEPIADFFDAFLLGDGEEAVLAILDVVAAGRARGASRAEVLHDLAGVDGIYVPSHFEIRYEGLRVTAIEALPGTPAETRRTKHGTPRVTRTTIADLDSAPYPTRTIVPNVTPVHDRVAIEIQRGCSQACRFCQAGMITRPTRQRRPETVLKLADESLAATGCNEVGLLSLSAGDYQPINAVLSEFFERYRDQQIAVSLPSMRTETMTPQLAEQVATVRKSGFTLAPEAGSERMRKVINKTNSEEDLMAAVRATVQAGWQHLKFYFMIGLPTETDEDVDAIAHVGERAREVGRAISPRMNVTVSVSTFVPKPHTSFQWEHQIDVETTRRKHHRLADRLRRSKIAFRYHSPEQSFLEGVLSRGDRRLGAAIEAAAAAGCRFDAWTEHFDIDTWLDILDAHLAPHGLRSADYLRERAEDSLLPWDHLDGGILKKFLLRDRAHAYDESVIEDCAFTDHCYACGGCDLGDPYRAKLKDADGKRLIEIRPTVFEAPPRERPEAAAAPDVDALRADAPRTDALLADAPQTDAPLADALLADAPRADAPRTDAPLADAELADAALAAAPRTAAPRVRLRYRYAKLGRAFFLSHLEVKEHVLRAVRLAGLPVLYSQGFNPRPRVGFSPACPTGVASEAEYFDVLCEAPVRSEGILERVAERLPDGIFATEVEIVSGDAPSLNEAIASMTYVVQGHGLTPAELHAAVDDFRAAAARPVRVLRKKVARVVDARAQVLAATIAGEDLVLTIAFLHSATLKIREAIAAILGGAAEHRARIRKRSVTFAAARLVPDAEPVGAPASDEPGVLDLTALGRPREHRPPRRPRRRADGQAASVPYAE